MKFQVPRMKGLRSWIHCCCSESALETLAHGFEGEGGQGTQISRSEGGDD